MKTLPALPATHVATGRNGGLKLQQSFVVKHKNGMHARPCALLVKNLWVFRCEADVEVNGQLANGHSIMGLMALAAGYESKMTFRITDEAAAQAMVAVQRLFDSHFAQAYA